MRDLAMCDLARTPPRNGISIYIGKTKLLPFFRVSSIVFKMISFSCYFVLSFVALSSTLVLAAPGRKHHGTKLDGIGVPVSNSEASDVIANRYIVVYNSNCTDEEVLVHEASVMTKMRKRDLEARGKNGQALSNKMQTFSMGGWRGMTIDAEDSMILEIESASEVRDPYMLEFFALLLRNLGRLCRGRHGRQDHSVTFPVECPGGIGEYITHSCRKLELCIR